jgi:hypothetical protein
LEDFSGVFVYFKPFLSFSKNKRVAEGFLNRSKEKENLTKVLFILEKDENVDYNLSTHCDLENISEFNHEKEVLFFPFSCFEIKDLKQKMVGNNNIYEIKLFYLGKYLKDIENDLNIITKEDKIPESKFKNDLLEFGLIKKKEINNINKKKLFKKFKEFKNNNNSNNNSNNSKDNTEKNNKESNESINKDKNKENINVQINDENNSNNNEEKKSGEDLNKVNIDYTKEEKKSNY